MARPRSYSVTSSNSTFSVNTLSSFPSESRPPSAPHTRIHTSSTAHAVNEQEMALGSMYDYLVKFILIGPSGCGKCVLGREDINPGHVYYIDSFETSGRH